MEAVSAKTRLANDTFQGDEPGNETRYGVPSLYSVYLNKRWTICDPFFCSFPVHLPSLLRPISSPFNKVPALSPMPSLSYSLLLVDTDTLTLINC